MLKKMVSRMVSFITAAVMFSTMTAFTAVNASAADENEYDFAAMTKEIALLVNEARAELGLKPVYVVPYLNEVADIRAEEITVEFAHKRRAGESFATVIDQSIVPFSFTAENIAAGSSTAYDTFQQWKESPGHWAAITNPEITHMGVGVAYDEDTVYKFYWQQTFVTTNKQFADQYIPTRNEIVPKGEGDVTGDGIVNTFDYVQLTNYLRKKKNNDPVYMTPAQLEAADCFKDGMITEADAKVMMRYILGEYKSLPFIF